jgi:choline transport protein
MEKAFELQTLDEEVLHFRGQRSVSESKMASDFDRDRYELARAGKQQVLKVRLFVCIFGFMLTSDSVVSGW